jgi:hypothetical protein
MIHCLFLRVWKVIPGRIQEYEVHFPIEDFQSYKPYIVNGLFG